MKKVQSPDGIVLLMENLWLRHDAGIKQRTDNVYEVEFAPPTAEEIAAAQRKSPSLSDPALNTPTASGSETNERIILHNLICSKT